MAAITHTKIPPQDDSAVGPFTVFLAGGAVKIEGPPKRVAFAAKLSDTIVSLGDPNGTHTECNVQFVQQ